MIGHTLEALADPKGFFEKRTDRYGLVFPADILDETCVYLLGPEANELVLFNPQHLFSSRFGWEGTMDRIFPGGLIMVDFDEHRLHRRALSVAFQGVPLHSYLVRLMPASPPGSPRGAAPGRTEFYPAVKQLELAARGEKQDAPHRSNTARSSG